MSRIPTHTVEDAPEASRPLLMKIAEATPTGRPANLHAQMAHSPAVLTAYTALRAVLAEHSGFDPKLGAVLTLAAAVGAGNAYMIRVASRLALMNGWTESQLSAVTAGDARTDALIALVRQAAAHAGNVSDGVWEGARLVGWSDRQLADAFAYIGATAFTASFLNYAQTELDL